MTGNTDNSPEKLGQKFRDHPQPSVDNPNLTMSTYDIAGLTGKRHDHILRDTRKMLKELNIPAPKFGASYRGDDGKDHPAFLLPKRETYILVSGYSTEMRSRIVDRWMELESVVAAPHDAVVKALDPTVATAIADIVHREVLTILPRLVEREVTADPRAVATEFKPALSILEERKVPSVKRRGITLKVSSRLRKFCVANGLPMRVSRETGRYLFHVDAIARWMAREGKALIAEHMATLKGQPQLKLVMPKG